jgi:hypothetical protein
MNKLIKNAKNQFSKTGKIVVTIYPNRDYENPEEIICPSLEGCIALINYSMNSQNDDLHIS